MIFERFFDETGDTHLVIHSPFGSRVNRAWGLALRKRFCRRFNFALQAAALEDSIVISLGAVHSFALDEVARYLTSKTIRDVLTQAVLEQVSAKLAGGGPGTLTDNANCNGTGTTFTILYQPGGAPLLANGTIDFTAAQVASMEGMLVEYQGKIASYVRAVRDAAQFHTYERLFSWWHISISRWCT